MDASVVLVNHNNAAYAVPAVKSVLKDGFTKKENFEVIVVDNGSREGEYETLKNAFRTEKRVKVVATGANLGLAGAVDWAAPLARARYVAILNDDTLVERGWGTAMLGQFGPNVAVVSTPTSDIYGPDEGPAHKEKVGAASLVERAVQGILNEPFPTAGACSMMYDKQLVGKPFDEDYFIYHEDAYLTMLTLLRGQEIRLAPGSRLLHYGSVTVGKKSYLKTFLSERNRLSNLTLFYSPANEIRLAPLVAADAITAVARDVAGLDFESFKARLAAYWWVVANFGKLMEKRKAIQAQRRAGDEAILKIHTCRMLPGKGILGKAVNAVSKMYCGIVGLECYETLGGGEK